MIGKIGVSSSNIQQIRQQNQVAFSGKSQEVAALAKKTEISKSQTVREGAKAFFKMDSIGRMFWGTMLLVAAAAGYSRCDSCKGINPSVSSDVVHIAEKIKK